MVLWVAIGLSVAGQGQAQLLENGDFELPAIPADSSVSLPTGSKALTGWSIGGTGGPVNVLNGFPISSASGPFTGSQYLSFNGGDSSPGTYIQQSFATRAGGRHELSFALGRFGSGAGDVRVTILIVGDNGSQLFLADLSQNPLGWAEHTISFVATTSSTTLRILDSSSATSQVDTVIDGVRLVSCSPGPKDVDLAQVEQWATWLENSQIFTASQSRMIAYLIVWYFTPTPPSPCD